VGEDGFDPGALARREAEGNLHAVEQAAALHRERCRFDVVVVLDENHFRNVRRGPERSRDVFAFGRARVLRDVPRRDE
jgi:hypothetical protein